MAGLVAVAGADRLAFAFMAERTGAVSGMSDIANAVQIQRGLGSSKLAISSVGGTVNFITKATDKKEGGFVSLGVANDNYFKTTAAYNTGMSKSGWGTSVMLSHWQGDGYNDGTRG